MSKQKYFSRILGLALLLPLLALSPVLAADSTSFDPTKVAVKAQGSGGVPVGTIIAWPVATNPVDWDKWLDCNGQSVSATVYPELFAVVGGNVPDYRGLFLRGLGGNSAALGSLQTDAIRNITGNFSADDAANSASSGVFAIAGNYWFSGYTNGFGSSSVMSFDASRQVPTAEENRPVNRAVRYLVRALP